MLIQKSKRFLRSSALNSEQEKELCDDPTNERPDVGLE